MANNIYLDDKHGVNPSIAQCFYCGQDDKLILVGKKTKGFNGVSDDNQMPQKCGIIDMEPCPECREFMNQGIILISISDDSENEMMLANEENRPPNPFRTGKFAVVKDHFIEHTINPPELAKDILLKRFCFVPDKAWSFLNLPDDNIDNRNKEEEDNV